MKNYYWGEAQEKLCRQWLSASTAQEQSRIYNALLPKLNEMAVQIMGRYFSVPSQRQTELKQDCVEEVFLKLKLYNPDKGRSGSYNFCGMIIKHYLMDVLVNKPQWIKHMDNKMVYIDQYDEYVKPLEFKLEDDFDYDMLLDLIKEKKAGFKSELAQIKKYGNVLDLTHKLEMLDLCAEFVSKYNCFNGAAVVYYIQVNTKHQVKINSIVRRFREIFGLIKTKEINLEGKEGSNFDGDNRHGYFQDDVVPTQNKHRRRQNLKAIKKKIGDYNQYEYF